MQTTSNTQPRPQSFEAHASSDFVYERVQYLAGEPFPREGTVDPVMVRRLYNARMIEWGKAPADLAAIARRRRAELDTIKAAELEAQQLAELEAATAPSAPAAAPASSSPTTDGKARRKAG